MDGHVMCSERSFVGFFPSVVSLLVATSFSQLMFVVCKMIPCIWGEKVK